MSQADLHAQSPTGEHLLYQDIPKLVTEHLTLMKNGIIDIFSHKLFSMFSGVVPFRIRSTLPKPHYGARSRSPEADSLCHCPQVPSTPVYGGGTECRKIRQFSQGKLPKYRLRPKTMETRYPHWQLRRFHVDEHHEPSIQVLEHVRRRSTIDHHRQASH